MRKSFPSHRVQVVQSADDAQAISADEFRTLEPVIWGRDRIGVGLLKALYFGSDIIFEDRPSPIETVQSRSGHFVVVEAGEDLSEVIAANYAFALGAGLCVIPPVPRDVAENLLETFYGAQENPDQSATVTLEYLKQRLRELVGSPPIPDGGSITFVTRDLPFGFAFPAVPSTHLFSYPDFGISVVNGLAAEQPGTRGINLAVVVDPEKTSAPEIEASAKTLANRGVMVRGYRGRNASVREVSDMVELFPYDLLVFATHCGDIDGYRWTYEFIDSEGHSRRLVVDIALGIAATDEPNRVGVTEFMRFHELDGVDWTDPDKEQKLYVGMAIRDFVESRDGDKIKPILKETIPRVAGSAALQMNDNIYVPLPQSVANNGTPIIINNSCVSWHELSQRFSFSSARAYVGTLFSVSNIEAAEIATKFLDKHFGKFLPHALWAAQNAVYGQSTRRPYVVTGVYTQRLRVTSQDMQKILVESLTDGLRHWSSRAAEKRPDSETVAKRIQAAVRYYKEELGFVKAMWPVRSQ